MSNTTGVAPGIRCMYPELDVSQLELIGSVDGHVLSIAGPGAGKTLCMALRAVNVLLQDLARPEEILLCTYNRDAATELRERFENAASSAGYQGDTGRVRICTIHSLCGRLLAGHPERVGLRPNFRLQDEPQRWNLLHRRFDEVFGPDQRELKHRGWKDAPNVIRNALSYIDRICDELILPGDLIRSRSPFLAALGRCYRRYERLLLDENAADFAHLQAWADLLLDDDDIASELSGGIRFIQCDEFQDTSYIQERILRRLSEVHGNFCVVGDEDQSLYRFRGATARNILRFPHRFPDCKVVRLTVNYRSHPTIVKCYDRWVDSADWSNSDPQGPPYRHPKTILPHAPERYDDYPAVIAIAGRDPDDEGRQLADLLRFLKSRRVIAGYHQVALLLHTVKDEAASTPTLTCSKAPASPRVVYPLAPVWAERVKSVPRRRLPSPPSTSPRAVSGRWW